MQVNSRHHQAVRTPGVDQRVVAQSPDGVVEAVESTTEWTAIGVQWHPEEMGEPHRSALFAGLVRACKEKLRGARSDP